MQYAIVQHSAAGYNGDPTFARGLESRQVSPAQARKVLAKGGVVFESYGAAEDYAEAQMFPEGYPGIIPQAPGAILRAKIDGLGIYVPRENRAKAS